MKCQLRSSLTNTLLPLLLEVIREHAEGISEFDLMKALEHRGVEWEFATESAALLLFQKHFTVMNGLYHLQQQIWSSGFYLSISALSIRIIQKFPQCQLCLKHPVDHDAISSLSLIDAAGDVNLRAYYFDWNNLKGMTSESVEEMLTGFWMRYHSADKVVDALEALGFKSVQDWDVIEKRYRQLAAEHHPDRGGSSERFIEVRKAYELLKLSQ